MQSLMFLGSFVQKLSKKNLWGVCSTPLGKGRVKSPALVNDYWTAIDTTVTDESKHFLALLGRPSIAIVCIYPNVIANLRFPAGASECKCRVRPRRPLVEIVSVQKFDHLN